jgi:hypothetical protein
MKKLALTLAAFAMSAAVVAPAVAKDRRHTADRSPSILECGIFFIPANCSPAERIIGGAIVGGALGFGVGAIVGASGGAITGGALAATTTGGVAGSYAIIGASAGAATGFLATR